MSKLFPEWESMGALRRVFEVLVLPIIGGTASGIAGGVGTGFYLLNTWAAITGAVVIGSQHRDRRTAVLRGLLSGTVYAVVLIVVLHLRGNERLAPQFLLPPNDVLLYLLMTAFSVPLHLFGSTLRVRLSTREPVAA